MNKSTAYSLTPSMASFLFWSSTFAPADSDIDSIRAAYDALCQHYTPQRPIDLNVLDHRLVSDGVDIPLRFYRPRGSVNEQPWIFYLHGGGFAVGGLDSHEFIAMSLAQDLTVTVVVVDYRLAPEFSFPCAHDDVAFVYQCLTQNPSRWGLSAQAHVVAGDSAGGNLAASLVAGFPNPALSGLAMVYPILHTQKRYPSYVKHAQAPGLTASEVDLYLDWYVPDLNDRIDLRLSPLDAVSLQGTPPTWVGVAEYDPVADDGREFVRRLHEEGMRAELYEGHGLVHGSLRAWRDCPDVSAMYTEMTRSIRSMLNLKEK